MRRLSGFPALSILSGLLAVAATATTSASWEAPPTTTDAISRPSEQRVRELVAIMSVGDESRLADYLAANATPEFLTTDPLPQLSWNIFLMGFKPRIEMYRDVSDTKATAVVHNPVTNRWHPLSVDVEPAPPHRIVRATLRPYATPPETYRPSPPPTEAERMAVIDAYVRKLAALERFSGIVLVAKNDEIIFERAVGLADRGFRVPNTWETRFNVGSIDKLFTALAAAKLVEEGRLSYDDPLSKFMDFPDRATAGKIKLKHLLSHTSGLGDYISPAYFELRTRFLSLDDYMILVDRLKPIELAFEPGQGWTYSNLGMLLVGRIIENVTREDYYDHIQKVVFDKAGMTNATDLRLDEVTPNVATLYEAAFEREKLRFINATVGLPARSAPDGGSVATARDFVKLAAALKSGKIVSQETLAMMTTSKDELGADGRYGYGIMNMSRRFGSVRRDVVGHGGDVDGGCAAFAMVRDADAPYTIVVLANSYLRSCFPVGEVVLEMIPPKG